MLPDNWWKTMYVVIPDEVINRPRHFAYLGKDKYPSFLQQTSPDDGQEAIKRLYELDAYFSLVRMVSTEAKARKHTRPLLQMLLNHVAGRQFNSLGRNRRFASELLQVMNRLNVRIACPHPGCGEPARIRCSRAGATLHGSFQFEHPIAQRQVIHATGVCLPNPLLLITAPPHRRTTKPLQGEQ